MPLFEIKSYEVSTYLQRFTGETRYTRILKMIGPEGYHGIQNKATFSFSTFFDGIWSNPVAGYLSQAGYSGLSVVGYFPAEEFEYYYDILRSESPVHVLYEFREAGASTGYLKKVGLGTNIEPIGEGPSDSEEALANILVENLTELRSSVIPMPVLTDLPTQRK